MLLDFYSLIWTPAAATTPGASITLRGVAVVELRHAGVAVVELRRRGDAIVDLKRTATVQLVEG